MHVFFTGSTKLISFISGTNSVEAQHIYSAWKQWVTTGSNAQWLQAFTTIGGDPLAGGQSVAPYFFLENGWKIRPNERDHELTIVGNLFSVDGSAMSIPTYGGFTVTVRIQSSPQALVVPVSSSALTSAQDALLKLIFLRQK